MKRQMVRSSLNHFLWVRWKVKPVLSGEPGAGPVWVIWSGFPSGSELLLSGAKRRRRQKVAVDSFLEEALVGDHSCSKQESLKHCFGFWILDENFVLAVACDLGTCTACCHVEPGARWPSSHGISVSKGSHCPAHLSLQIHDGYLRSVVSSLPGLQAVSSSFPILSSSQTDQAMFLLNTHLQLLSQELGLGPCSSITGTCSLLIVQGFPWPPPSFHSSITFSETPGRDVIYNRSPHAYCDFFSLCFSRYVWTIQVIFLHTQCVCISVKSFVHSNLSHLVPITLRICILGDKRFGGSLDLWYFVHSDHQDCWVLSQGESQISNIVWSPSLQTKPYCS